MGKPLVRKECLLPSDVRPEPFNRRAGFCVPCPPALSLLAFPALAHDALPTVAKPLGWSYPFACCANYDCRATHTGEVLERPEAMS